MQVQHWLAGLCISVHSNVLLFMKRCTGGIKTSGHCYQGMETVCSSLKCLVCSSAPASAAQGKTRWRRQLLRADLRHGMSIVCTEYFDCGSATDRRSLPGFSLHPHLQGCMLMPTQALLCTVFAPASPAHLDVFVWYK